LGFLIRQGTGYIDDGVVCQDAEDGLISNVLPDSEESLGSLESSEINAGKTINY